MNAVLSIAVNTFRETIRNKALYSILLIAVGIILLAVFVGDWSVFARAQVMQDFGLATMSITSMLLAVFIGVGMLGREVSTRTAYTVLTKAIARWQFVTGKFLGLLTLLLVNCLLLSAVLWTAIFVSTGQPQPLLLPAMAMIMEEMAVMVAAAVFFSTVTSPMLAAAFTLAFYLVGHWNDVPTLEAAQRSAPAAAPVLKVFSYLLPNLEHFNIRTAAVYGLPLPDGYIPLALLYGVLYAGLLLLLSCVVFSRKDL